jgi:two-component sensor histidine kinase
MLLCVLGGAHFKRGVQQEFYRETANIAEILMAAFDEDTGTANAILTRLATDIAPETVSQAHETELHRLLAGYTLQPSMIGPAILDRDGTLIASARIDPVPKISLRDRNIFRVQAETPNKSDLYIGTPMRGPITQEWAIQFSRPLRDQSGDFYGVVLLSYRLSHFVALYEKLKLSDRGLAGLTGKDGVVRIRSLNGEIGYGNAVSKNPLAYDRVLAGEKTGKFYGRSTVDGVTRIGTFVASPTTPFYVTVGYDVGYLRAQYIGFFYVLGLCWFLLTTAMIATAVFIRHLEKVGQQTQLDVVNSAIAERQKLSADMHDSIGSSLAALLAYFTTENIDMAEVKRKVGEILMELRFLVDSAEPVHGDVNLLFSNVLHRMGAGIELAGIDLRWQADELSKIPGLSARDALTIKLVLMEALTNVLHHSKAKSTALTAHYDARESTIFIAVTDDGCGFDSAKESMGHGLSNMRKRIASISTGGSVAIDSAPGRGTTVRIELKVPPLSG